MPAFFTAFAVTGFSNITTVKKQIEVLLKFLPNVFSQLQYTGLVILCHLVDFHLWKTNCSMGNRLQGEKIVITIMAVLFNWCAF